MALGGAVAAGLGSSVLALASLVATPLVAPIAFLGLAVTVLGVAVTFCHLVQRDGRETWLASRAKAERLRQFYFQYYVNNLDLASEGIADDKALAKLEVNRAEALKQVVRKLDDDARERPNLIVADHLHDETWLQPGWRTPTFGPGATSPAHLHLLALLTRLESQRLRIQLRYAEANRQRTINAPGERHALLDLAGNLLTLAVIAAATCGAALNRRKLSHGVALGESLRWQLTLFAVRPSARTRIRRSSLKPAARCYIGAK